MKKLNKKRMGFTLVELIIVISIIAILSSVAFVGGSTIINKARVTRTNEELRMYAQCIDDMFYAHPSWANKGIKLPIDDSMNEFLTSNLKVTGSDVGTSVFKDSWKNPYNYKCIKTEGKSETAIFVWSNGIDGVNNSTPNIMNMSSVFSGDDIGIIIKSINSAVSIETSEQP